MSTKAIREVLGDAGFRAPDTCDEAMARKVAAAWSELERIETTAKTLSIHYTATIRAEGMPNAADLLETIAREAP